MTKAKLIDYEELAQTIYNQILQLEGYNVKVEHNKKIKGKDYEHQIDVYWELKVADVITKYLIEVKDYTSAVSIDKIKAFITTINDIHGSHGIFIAKSGFQKGVKELAVKNGIQMYELRDAKEEDFAGKIMKLNMNLDFLLPHYDKLTVEISKEKNPNFVAGRHLYTHEDTIIYENEKPKTLWDIIQNLCKRNDKVIKYAEVIFEENTYMIKDNEKIFINKISGEFGMAEHIEKIQLNGYEQIEKILFNVIDNTAKLFNKDNEYIKDIFAGPFKVNTPYGGVTIYSKPIE